jgi:RNA polymerase sigma factor (sigma-70 family)
MSAQWQEADNNFYQIAEAARKGDAYAQGKLLEAYRPELLRQARQMEKTFAGGGKTGSDFVQAAFYSALEEIKAFRGCTPEQLEDWLDAILCRTVMNEKRRSRALKRDIRREVVNGEGVLKSVRDTARSAERTAEQKEECDNLRRALGLLPVHYSQVLLYWASDLSWEEVGERMGRSADAARVMHDRAMPLLTKHLRARSEAPYSRQT